jgi:peptide/nickel transport system permease protein
VLTCLVILFFVALLIYLLMRLMPTSYVESIARQRASLPGSKSYDEWLAQLNAVYGLDLGVVEGFFRWIGSAIRGDFGDSWYFNVPVTEKFKDVIWYSFALASIGLLLELAIAIPLGILSARKQYTWTDYSVTVFALIGISLPTFFVATLYKLIFSIKAGVMPLYGVVGRYYEQLSPTAQFFDIAVHFILPIATIVTVSIGSLMRFTRTNMLEVLNSDFIRTARAKGLPENKVINHHAFRNTLIPIVGGTLPGLFGGALITETLFQIPGIGWTSYQAMVGGDIPFSMFYLLFLAILTLTGTLIADILYAVVDPRVRVNK